MLCDLFPLTLVADRGEFDLPESDNDKVFKRKHGNAATK